ncbi:MAG: glycosyltransferase, partial [Nitrospinaceae bacterium]|nr:glycosyltransferase [Nitrospinaceae bacterium]NIR54849.1 glycosyltransferase [Nitrospinaceae bacterium]NIS85274.1 glycosyltransferase [Nitrospinaceae bacterium]NIT82087.1 glycosyltransferase [Nitrospinaceae bacterium]NIU44348.1 glycosyltransferase [Nitrospinaceae bacterium]
MSSEPLEPHWASRPEQALTSSVSVIMPVYNGEGFLDRSLPPLLRMVQRGEVREVIVVDDASTDQTSRRAADLGARVVST